MPACAVYSSRVKILSVTRHQAHSRKGAQGACRNRLRRRVRRDGRPSWVAPLRRVNYALASTERLLESTHHAIDRAWDTCFDAPVRTARDLHRAHVRLLHVIVRLKRAARRLTETSRCIEAEPERAAYASALLDDASRRWDAMVRLFETTVVQFVDLRVGVCEGLEYGELVPEDPAVRRRPRIILAPRTISARAFLLFRRSSARARIASVPTPRRRARIAAVDAPRRISRGRAPPPASTCTI